ncbi:hypothetical protein [Rheinheimera hassiensis]|uniref:hypothetical protein n=1 Tax=Rheinheimera hassiensis TaxID=1193627 RepID=UPI001F06C6E4|nr:hypothetical protein [Rheinheimera hassiensis]
MKTHADKMHENKNKSAVNTDAKRETSGTSTFRFVDNRHEASQMRKLHEMANSSSRVKQLRAFQKLTHTSSQTTPLQSVIQRQCDHCDNVACDDGSICNYNGRAYGIGQHGARRSEQQRLTDEFGQAVSGDTHQSEHYYGFAVLNETSGQSRRESGRFEREAHAYQEVHGAHRAHVGTGTSSTVGASGFSADTYRDDQRALLESGNPSAAGQLNTLGYAFQPSFQGSAQTTEGQQASSSFVAMMGQMQDVTYMQGTTPRSIPVSANDRLEQLAARFAVERGHNWPTADDIADARNDLGM